MKSNRMKFCLLITVLVILGQTVAFAAAAAPLPPGGGGGNPQYTVYGYVKRSGTNQRLWCASVKVYKDGDQYVGSTVTSTSGYFSVSFDGSCDFVKIEVSCWGYHDTYNIVDTKHSGTSIYVGSVYISPKKGCALVVGISDYQYGGDLHLCDEDATDWYYELNDRGFDIRVYGDTHSENYPVWHGKATKSILRHYVSKMAHNAGPGDTLVFTFAGHGGPMDIYNNDQGYMATWENYAEYHDHEFYSDFLGTQASRIFIFLDTCRSGCFIDEFQEDTSGLKQKVFITTAAPWDGKAFDMYNIDFNRIQNGAWSHFFITECDDYPTGSMETCFSEACYSFHYWYVNGPYLHGKHTVFFMGDWLYHKWDWPPGSGLGPGDGIPQCFDGNTGSAFYL